MALWLSWPALVSCLNAQRGPTPTGLLTLLRGTWDSSLFALSMVNSTWASSTGHTGRSTGCVHLEAAHRFQEPT